MTLLHYSGYESYVSGVITQGQTDGIEYQWVTTYKVSTSMNTSLNDWKYVINQEGSQVIMPRINNTVNFVPHEICNDFQKHIFDKLLGQRTVKFKVLFQSKVSFCLFWVGLFYKRGP